MTTLAKLQNVKKNHYLHVEPCSCTIYILSEALHLRITYIWYKFNYVSVKLVPIVQSKQYYDFHFF